MYDFHCREILVEDTFVDNTLLVPLYASSFSVVLS